MKEEDLYKYIYQALIEGIELLEARQSVIEEKRTWGGLSLLGSDRYRYGRITKFDSGVTRYDAYGGKFRYHDAIDFIQDEDKLPSWSAYYDFACNSEFLRKYYDLGMFGEITEEARGLFYKGYVMSPLGKLLDSYIYLNDNEFSINEELLERLVKDYVDQIFSKTIEFEIWIPLIYTNFDFTSFQLSDSISIERIPDELQVARNANLSVFTDRKVNNIVIEGCSHAIVIKGFEAHNSTSSTCYKYLENTINDDKFRKRIEDVAGAIGVVTGEQLFYYQVFARSNSYTFGRHADIKTVLTINIDEELPTFITDYGWLNVPRTVSIQEMKDVKLLFTAIQASVHSKVSFAIRKLISACSRNQEEDKLLDTTIALESILSNDSKSEITYRLSLRGAMVCKKFPLIDLNPSDVRDLLKKIYAYRSAIVHGAKDSEKQKRSIAHIGNKTYSCGVIAILILRHCLRFFIENPNYLDLKMLEDGFLNKE